MLKAIRFATFLTQFGFRSHAQSLGAVFVVMGSLGRQADPKLFRSGGHHQSTAARISGLHRVVVDDGPIAAGLVALAPVLFLALTALAKLVAPGGYLHLVREDGPVEWATAFVYLVAFAFATGLVVALRRQKATVFASLYGLLAFGLLLIAMEEISWGQRIFGFETPAPIADVNMKGELNFHNVYGFPVELAFVLVGFYGSFSRLIVPPSIKARFPTAIELLTPPYRLFLYFFCALALFAYFYAVWLENSELVAAGLLTWEQYWSQRQFIHGKDQEAIELLLAGGFLLFTWRNYVRCRKALERSQA